MILTQYPVLNDIEISHSDVFDILTSLDGSKASGIDNISAKIFRI